MYIYYYITKCIDSIPIILKRYLTFVIHRRLCPIFVDSFCKAGYAHGGIKTTSPILVLLIHRLFFRTLSRTSFLPHHVIASCTSVQRLYRSLQQQRGKQRGEKKRNELSRRRELRRNIIESTRKEK